MTSKRVFVVWWGSWVSPAGALPDVIRVVFLIIEALLLKAIIIWIRFDLVYCCIFVVIFIVVFVIEPFREIIHYLGIGLRLDPRLEVPDDVLIVQAAQVGYLATYPFVFLWIQLLREKNLFDGVYIAVEAMSSLIYDSEATSANFFKLFKVISVPRDLSHVVENGVIVACTPPMSFLRLFTFINDVISGSRRLLSSRILVLSLTRLTIV